MHNHDLNLTTHTNAVNMTCPHLQARCQGVSCMAWRYVHPELVLAADKPPGTGWVDLSSDGGLKTWSRPHPSKGYCGLAGRP